jgi:peptide/nickel transport system permease protein
MGRYLTQRLLELPVTVFLVTIFIFGLMHMVPGDPIVTALGPFAAEDSITAYRAEYGLDQPLLKQYVDWVTRIVQGNMGKSINSKEPVTKMIADRLPVTLTLSGTAAVIYVAIAFPCGILAALFKNTWIDYAIRVFSTLGVAVPGFFLAIVLIVIFGVKLEWLPFAGYISPADDLAEGLKHLAMPAISMGIMSTGYTIRMLRACILDVMGSHYIRTARSKGLSSRIVILRHAIPNALLPIITVLVINAAFMVSGSVISEMIFSMPGMGRLMLDAVTKRDYPVIQGVTLFMGVIFVLSGLVADICYAIVDPRVRYDSAKE